MADADDPSEEDLLREASTPGPTSTGSKFAALLQEMKKRNENILAVSEPAEFSDGFPTRENNVTESLDERVAELIASGSSEPNVFADVDGSTKTGSAASEGLAGIVNSLFERVF